MEHYKPIIKRAPCHDEPLRIAVLVSGNGSNLKAMLDYQTQNPGCFKIALVLCNDAKARAVIFTKKAKIPFFVISHKNFTVRKKFEDCFLEKLFEYNIELVVLAGFMRVLSKHFIDSFNNKIVNVHPALCPAFPGLHATKQAIEHGAKISGCTVHLVNEGVDEGPILAQEAVYVFPHDTEKTLQARIQSKEHILLSHVVHQIAQGLIWTNGKKSKQVIFNDNFKAPRNSCSEISISSLPLR